mgnify:FL=1
MSKLTNCLVKRNTSCVPIWFMRQAGRYLPEFKEIRSKNQDFIKLCLNSNLSSTITLQPIKRFDLNAAIIFSDILMVPYALGQEVKFEKNEGPKLSELNLDFFLKKNEKEFTTILKPVYEAISKTRKKLDNKKNLISFIGSPWTLIVYILGLKKEKNVLDVELVKKKSAEISILIEKLNNFLCLHIKNQIDAGADLVQIFDSWSGLIPTDMLNDYCYKPNLYLVNFCKSNHIPVICFPKGLKNNYKVFNRIVKPTGISIDYDIDPLWARKELSGTCIQGGLDPKILLSDKETMFKKTEEYLKIFKDYPYIFNLGHGLLPETKPDSVNELINFIRNYK